MPTITSWDDSACPIPVDYSREAFGEIRRAAIDGFLALPRVGIGVGGLLLGLRENGRITILDSVPIECSHADGPPFTLTPDEIAMAAELGEAADPLLVVGWYCSKTRGTVALSERDLILYDSLCPEPWQVALLVRPRTVEPARAALCFRGVEGMVVRGADRVLQPFEPASDEIAGDDDEIAGDDAVAETAPPTPAAEEERPPSPMAAEPSAAAPIAEPPAEAPSFIPPPLFAFMGPPPRASAVKRVGWALAAAALMAGAGAGLVSWNDGTPKPRLRLSASDSGGKVTLRWNADSVPGIDHASLLVDDGGPPQNIPLDGAQLRSGQYQFERKSGHVTATLTAGAARALASFPE